MQGDSQQANVLVTLGIPQGWVCATDIPLIHTSCMVYIDHRVQYAFNHSRQTLDQNTRSHNSQACSSTYIHVSYVAHLCGRMVIHNFFFFFFYRDRGHNCDQKRTAHWFSKPHIMLQTYISKRKKPAWRLWYAQHDLNMLRPCLSLQLTHFNSE